MEGSFIQNKFIDRVEQFCERFPVIKEHVPEASRILENRPVDVSTGPASLEVGLAGNDGLVLLQAWSFLTRESLISCKPDPVNSLIQWLWELVSKYRLRPVELVTEWIRVFLTLRVAFYSSCVNDESYDMILNILVSQSIGPILPFLWCPIGPDHLEDILLQAVLPASDPKLEQAANRAKARIKEYMSGASKSPSCNYDSEGSDMNSDQCSIDSDQEALLTHLKLSSRPNHDPFIACHPGSLEVIHRVRLVVWNDNICRLGSFERELLAAAFKSRSSRSDAVISLTNYLELLEGNSDKLTCFATRFKKAGNLIFRLTGSYPPSLPVAEALTLAISRLITVANEFDYSKELKQYMLELKKDSMKIVESAIASARVTMNMDSSMMNNKSRTRPSPQGKRRNSSSVFGGIRRRSLFRDSVHKRQSVTHLKHPTARVYDWDWFDGAPANTKVARIPGIWLQVDPSAENTSANNPDIVGDEEVTSSHSGVLRVYKNRITWVMVRRAEKLYRGPVNGATQLFVSMHHNTGKFAKDPTQTDTSSMFAIYNAVSDDYGVSPLYLDPHKKSFNIGPGRKGGYGLDGHPGSIDRLTKPISKSQFFRQLHSQMGRGPGDSGPPQDHHSSSKRLSILSDPSTSDDELKEDVDSLFTIPIGEIRRYASGSLDEESHFIAIYTDEVIKLYPFSRVEATELLKALHDLTGMKPTISGQKCEKGVKQKLEDVRLRILDENILKNKKSKWITHTEELLKVLKDLTKDDSPLKMVEMERVYHSCRNNKAVIHESIWILKELWQQAKTQDKMMKILAIVDRFLDGDILNGDDAILAETLEWLHQIETTLDPYSKATPLKLLLKVCQRAESLQSQTIVPFIEIFYDDSVFDHSHEYEHYLKSFS